MNQDWLILCQAVFSDDSVVAFDESPHLLEYPSQAFDIVSDARDWRPELMGHLGVDHLIGLFLLVRVPKSSLVSHINYLHRHHVFFSAHWSDFELDERVRFELFLFWLFFD